MICNTIVGESECVSVIVTCSREPVIAIVESLPLVLGVSDIVHVSVMQYSCLFQERVESFEVEANNSFELSSVE